MSSRVFKISFVLLLFLLGLGFMSRFMHRPVDSLADVPTALSMIAMENWSITGALEHALLTPTTYPGEANSYIWSSGTRAIADDGTGYYISVPPLSLLIPYSLLKPFSLETKVFWVRFVSLFLHALAAFFVYCLTRLLLDSQRLFEPSAFASSLIYYFYPFHLDLFATMVSWHTTWQALWIIGLYFAVRFLKQGKSQDLLLFSLFNILAVYTDYQGAVFALTLTVLYFFKNKNRNLTKLAAASIGTVLLVVLVSSLQIYTRLGADSFYRLVEHAQSRTILGAQSFFALVTLYHYGQKYTSLLFSLVLLLLLRTIFFKGKFEIRGEQPLVLFGFLLTPVVLHHILFLNWTAIHPSSILRGGVFIAVLLGILAKPFFMRGRVAAVSAAVFLFAAFMLPYSNYSFARTGEKAVFQVMSQEIKDYAEPEEVVFVVSEIKLWTPLIYNSKRNLQSVPDVDTAKEILRKRKQERGVVFWFDSKGICTGKLKIAI